MNSNEETFNAIQKYKTPLKQISCDSSASEALVNSDYEMVNFDAVKDADSSASKSCDGLDVINDVAYLVEFKNGCIEYNLSPKAPECCQSPCEEVMAFQKKYIKASNDKLKTEIWIKISDSIVLYSKLRKCLIEDLKKDVVFILVYNSSKNNFNSIAGHVGARAKKEIDFLGIRSKYKCFFRDVQVMSEKEFVSYMNKLGIRL